jgi:hypothetical protein
MPLALQFLFACGALLGITVGSFMILAPNRYPNLYDGFLNERVMRREVTEQGRIAAIRMQGLIALACGAFFALFVWALP